MSSNYALDSYASFETEQLILEAESKKKDEHEKRITIEEKEVQYRFRCICGYFLRSSFRWKKQFILSMVKHVKCLDNMLRIISVISVLLGKMAAYVDVSPHCKATFEQIVIDHDRGLELDCLTETACDDLAWLSTLPERNLMVMIIELLRNGGGGLMRIIYIPIISIYNSKVMAEARLLENNLPTQREEAIRIFDEPEPDDSDKYPREHPQTVEVEKLRRKWDETIDKYRRDLFPIEKRVDNKIDKADKKSKAGDKEKPEKPAKEKGKSSKKAGDKATNGSLDWIQMLPVWIVKKILDHFDQKTLQTLKKVNSYWSYACDNLLKDRQAREFLDKALEKMVSNVNPATLNQYRQNQGLLVDTTKKPDSPREKRIKKLMNRGAVLESIRPTVKKSNQTRACLTTSMPTSSKTCDPLAKLTAFPRLIKEDLLLYKKYPCILKDVNVVFDVDESMKKQRDTLSYTLSQQLSDTFSLSEANLADW